MIEDFLVSFTRGKRRDR